MSTLSGTPAEAQAVIEALALVPHPEGGWYRETWRSASGPGERAAATAILFLLEAGQRSHWHRVDAAELWLWHAGAPLELAIAADDAAAPELVRVGPNMLGGERPQQLVPAASWQAATATTGWALVSCVVSPGFDFAGFTLAPIGWAPGAVQIGQLVSSRASAVASDGPMQAGASIHGSGGIQCAGASTPS